MEGAHDPMNKKQNLELEDTIDEVVDKVKDLSSHNVLSKAEEGTSSANLPSTSFVSGATARLADKSMELFLKSTEWKTKCKKSRQFKEDLEHQSQTLKFINIPVKKTSEVPESVKIKMETITLEQILDDDKLLCGALLRDENEIIDVADESYDEPPALGAQSLPSPEFSASVDDDLSGAENSISSDHSSSESDEETKKSYMILGLHEKMKREEIMDISDTEEPPKVDSKIIEISDDDDDDVEFIGNVGCHIIEIEESPDEQENNDKKPLMDVGHPEYHKNKNNPDIPLKKEINSPQEVKNPDLIKDSMEIDEEEVVFEHRAPLSPSDIKPNTDMDSKDLEEKFIVKRRNSLSGCNVCTLDKTSVFDEIQVPTIASTWRSKRN